MSKYSDKAIQLFYNGSTCSQAVFAAFAPELGLSEETALHISLGLGGGVGRMREVCGAISGAAMLVGLRFPDITKAEAYKKVRLISNEFRKTNSSIICRELLGLSEPEKSYEPEPRTEEYYKKRPCIKIIGDAALAVEKILFSEEDE